MSDLTLEQVAMRVVAVLLISAVHGGVLAGISIWLGDEGPRHDGMLGFSPVRHLDIVGGLAAVLFSYGWIRPIAIDVTRLRPGRAAMLAVVLAPAVAVLGMAFGLRLLRPVALNLLGDTESEAFFVLVDTIGGLAITFTLFNLLPLPPMTGGHLLEAAFPARRASISRLGTYAGLAMALLIASSVVGRVFAPAEAALARVIMGS